jgi:hypothetical protein
MVFARLLVCAMIWGPGCVGHVGSTVDGGSTSASAGAGGSGVAGNVGSVGIAGTVGSGSAGATGTAGTGGTTSAGVAGTTGTGTSGTTGAGGRGGTTGTGTAGTTGAGGRGGTTGAGGRGGAVGTGGTTGAGGRGGTTGAAGSAGGSGSTGRGGTTGTAGTSGSAGAAGTIKVGAHASAYIPVGQQATMISLPAMTTQAAGSTIVVCDGRGNNLVFAMAGAAPSDNLGNPTYPQVGQMEPYAHPYESSGTAVYALTGAKGGAGMQIHAISGTATNGNYDESTMFAVEVIGGSRVQNFQWSEMSAASTSVTSMSVTTTGPATIVSCWWGEATLTSAATVSVNNSFQVIESVLQPGSVVQGAMAVRTVTAAGTYNVTWSATPSQGAQIWMVAIQ